MKTNIHNLQIGDKIEFVNSVNYRVTKTIVAFNDKSVYCHGRESWGTFNGYIAKYKALIVRK